MKIAIYSRKSKFTGKGESIENQIEMCRNYAIMHFGENCEISIYEDEGFSGGTTNRPQFKLLLDSAKNKEFDVLICYRLDRVSRNIADFSTLISDLQNYEIGFVSIKEQFDTTTPLGRAMMYISGVFAQLERETIAERVRDNLTQLAKTGRWLGGITPIGFISIEITQSDHNGKIRKMKKLSPVDEEIELVQLIFSKYLELRSLTKIETYLMNSGYKSRNGVYFSRFALRAILVNPVYATADAELYDFFIAKDYAVYCEKESFNGINGVMAFNRTLQKSTTAKRFREPTEWIISVGEHKGIISSATWIKVQDLVIQNKSKNYRSPRNRECLLAGILKCGDCGSYMRPKYGRIGVDGKRMYTYMCTLKERSRSGQCSIKNAPGEELDISLSGRLKDLASDRMDVRKKIMDQELTITTKSSSLVNEISTIKAKIKSDEDAISNLIAAISKGAETSEYLIKEINRLEDEILSLKETLSELNEKSNFTAAQGSQFELINNMIESLASTFDTLILDDKRSFIKTITESVIWDGKNVNIVLFGKNLAEK